MSDKPKCSQCNQRDATHKGLCSGCYGKNWRLARKAERAAEAVPAPKQLTSGVTEDELAVIEGEIVHDDVPAIPETHLVATSPVEMEASRDEMKAHLEQKLTVIERDIVEANAALNEARRNGWATGVLLSARNRLVDDETYYNKILAAVEAGHTIIPDFPIQVFAVRTSKPDRANSYNTTDRGLHAPAKPDCSPAGAGEYRSPDPEVDTTWGTSYVNSEGRTVHPHVSHRTGRPSGPITFPSHTARSPIMKATAAAMADKTFDQIGVCLPVATAPAARQVQTRAARAGDPLVIGQVVRKAEGSRQKVVSFIIAWHLNLNDL